ncbi:MFS general substrate transporter [Aspergillus affinis]|uniref:MFS general substrate transporter n=1 Tax=Aspergillus affinis TaxID=1070780 RepID=UPI0022FE7852|nr:MFS general substrate transporter [Aspergillus affinis]KAI9043094.1 MFS general substrate transporter [Aspergillus affinis]
MEKSIAPREDTVDDRELSPGAVEDNGYLSGLRLHLVTAALAMCLFLTNLEIPIVTTALMSITEEIGGLDKVYWIIAGYMLGYVGVLVITAKISDLFGRKSSLLVAVGFFLVFSGACGGAQTISQLIIFRAFQGIGGAGNYSLCTTIVLELVPPAKYALYTSSLSVVYAISLLLGPILGGAISETNWRWIFWLNLPPAALAGLVIIFMIPNRFPNHHKPRTTDVSLKNSLLGGLRRLDFIGSSLLLIATVCLAAPLEEANREFAWRSAFTIVMLVISGFAWIIFLLWERRVTLSKGLVEPVFPWRFAQNRVWMGMLLNAICLGGTWFVTIFQLPQRFQIVNGLSPLQAGIRFIPFTVAAPIGSIMAPMLSKIFKIPVLYFVIAASFIQVIAYALLSTLSDSVTIAAKQYGFQILAGYGCGINIALLVLMTPFTIEPQDKAVAMGTVAQFRVMGGTICLAIVTAASQALLRSRLGHQLPPSQVDAILQSTEMLTSLSPDTQDLVRQVYSAGYNLQMKILAGFAGGQVIASGLMWQKQQVMV